MDNLPSATKVMSEGVSTYLHGFPIGYMDADNEANLFNHVTIIVKVHLTQTGSYRIVGFEIKAGSFAAGAYTVAKDGRSCEISTKGHQ